MSKKIKKVEDYRIPGKRYDGRGYRDELTLKWLREHYLTDKAYGGIQILDQYEEPWKLRRRWGKVQVFPRARWSKALLEFLESDDDHITYILGDRNRADEFRVTLAHVLRKYNLPLQHTTHGNRVDVVHKGYWDGNEVKWVGDVTKWKKRAYKPNPSKKLPDEEIAEMRRLWESGLTRYEIARKMNRSHETVRKYTQEGNDGTEV